MNEMTITRETLSFMGRSWEVREPDIAALTRLRTAGEDPLAARIMSARGIDRDTLTSFVTPKIQEALPNPMSFLGMQAAAERLAQAIREGQTVGIWSDYDADGATSGAILGSFLRLCGRGDFQLRIPDRIEEGYGPNTPGLLAMRDAGCDLICILDSGTTAFEPLAAAKEAGIEVIVIDHHAAEETLPEAVAVVNPNRKDQPEGQGHICAAGMTFIFAIATTMLLRKEGWFDGKDGRPATAPDLWSLLDLVALGTVCDVVPLIGVNRAFVYRGLPLLTARGRPGIKALAAAAGIDPLAPITEKECGWVLGPRINAGGRIGQSDSGALLLLEEDPEKATARAEALHALNTERRQLEAATTEAAIEQLADRRPGVDRGLALAVVEDAHEGVVGISAARLREAYDAPAIVLSRAHDGALKGSARSVPGFDIGHAIIAARQAGILVKGGGHGMAGGLTIEESRLAEFVAFMDGEIGKTEYARIGVVSQADARLTLAEFTVAGLRGMDRMRPFGTANEEPRIVLAGAVLQDIRVLKEIHFKLVLEDRGVTVDALMWNAANLPIAREIREAIGSRVDVYGTGSINAFRGKETPQIVISDIRLTPGVLL